MGRRSAVRVLLVSVLVLLPLGLASTELQAGVNAGATAHMYWQPASCGLGSQDRNSTDTIPQLVVTVTGLKRFQGADVQLAVQGLDSLGNICAVPPAWQLQQGGCDHSRVWWQLGGFSGDDTTAYPSIFLGVSGIATAQEGMYYQYTGSNCIAPDTTGMIWLQSAGAAAVDVDSTQEYAVFSFRLNLRGNGMIHCDGDLHDPNGPRPVLLKANYHQPCEGPQPGAAIAILADGDLDYIPIANGFDTLTWEAGQLENLQIWPGLVHAGMRNALTISMASTPKPVGVALQDSAGGITAAADLWGGGPSSVTATFDVPASATGPLRVLLRDQTHQFVGGTVRVSPNTAETTPPEPPPVLERSLPLEISGWWPVAMAVDTGSNVYVITQSDTSDEGRLFRFGSDGTVRGRSGFAYPYAVAVTPEGHALVLETSIGAVTELDSNLALVRSFQYPDYGMLAMAVDANGNIWTAGTDRFNYEMTQVKEFSPSGTLLRIWGGAEGEGGAQDFDHPWGIAVDSSGIVFILDHTWSERVMRFTENGTYLSEWGGDGQAPGQFDGANSISLDEGGQVVVSDVNNGRIQLFTGTGEFLTSWTLNPTPPAKPGRLQNRAETSTAGTPWLVAVDHQCHYLAISLATYYLFFFKADRDTDGLCDCWEGAGKGIAHKGGRYELHGSDPNRKDLYVELDAMSGVPQPSTHALNLIVHAFDSAPVSNPGNARGGIALHFENNQGCDSCLDDTILPQQDTWSGLSNIDPLRPQWFGTADDRTLPADTKTSRLRAKHRVLRYGIVANRFLDPADSYKNKSGQAELPGNDFFVTFGRSRPPITDSMFSGTIMHELGHNLGLHHGGVDDLTYKPNYISVMNYLWQMPVHNIRNINGIQQREMRKFWKSWRIDYSRSAMGVVNESVIPEQSAIPGESSIFEPIGPRCLPDTSTLCRLIQLSTDVDWNSDGIIGGSDCRDVTWLPPTTGWRSIGLQFQGASDWDRLLYLPNTLKTWTDDTVHSSGGAAVVGCMAWDEYDALDSLRFDCNGNGIADDQDIALGTSMDLDEDGVPDECEGGIPGISIDSVAVVEGQSDSSMARFTVSLSYGSTHAVTVRYHTSDGSATWLTHDYRAMNDSVVFAPGARADTIRVPVYGDSCGEVDERFSVHLTSAEGGVCEDSIGICTIINDDDTLSPIARVLSPNGGEHVAVGTNVDVRWSASDNVGVASIDLKLSRDGGASYPDTIATGVPNSGVYSWGVAGIGTNSAKVKVLAYDDNCNVGVDESDGVFQISGPTSVGEDSSDRTWHLSSIRPNPSRGPVRIDYGLPRSERVQLSVMDVSGRQVAVLVDGVERAGGHHVAWAGQVRSGRPAAVGVYFVRLRTASGVLIRRMVLLR